MLLKKTLLANACFSLVCGLLLLSLPGKIAALLGTVPVWLLMVLGCGLIVFAADVYWISRQLPRSQRRAEIILWADIAWVILTPVVLVVFASAFSQLGMFLVVDVAVIVALFAWMEWKGLQELNHKLA